MEEADCRERANGSQEEKRWMGLQERAGTGVSRHTQANTTSCSFVGAWALTVQYFFLEMKTFLSTWRSDSCLLPTITVTMQIF